MEILNHLEDLSDYGIEYTEEDKNIFVEFQNAIKDAGYNIKYMNAPVDITEGGVISAISKRFSKVSYGDELFKQLVDDFVMQTEHKQVFDNRIYIYEMSKLKCLNSDVLYKIRIGTAHKFN